MAAMELGLAHSLSRYKLKFSPDKIDTMIVQVSPKCVAYFGGLKESIRGINITVLLAPLAIQYTSVILGC